MGAIDKLQVDAIKNYCLATKLVPTLSAIFESIVQTTNWEEECEGIKHFIENMNPYVGKKRWGRIGIDFSDTWSPGLFAGVVFNNDDHKLRNWNDIPQLVIILDKDIKKFLEDESYQSKINSINQKLSNLDLQSIEMKRIYSDNKWRLLILGIPLTEVISEDEDQIESIKNKIVEGINCILEALRINKNPA